MRCVQRALGCVADLGFGLSGDDRGRAGCGDCDVAEAVAVVHEVNHRAGVGVGNVATEGAGVVADFKLGRARGVLIGQGNRVRERSAPADRCSARVGNRDEQCLSRGYPDRQAIWWGDADQLGNRA